MNLKKSNLNKARRFTNTFYFIDDLCAINDNDLFEKYFKEIYPEELKLKRENISKSKASFFTIDLVTKDNKISSKLYDKRDFLPFGIVRAINMPFFNILSKSF